MSVKSEQKQRTHSAILSSAAQLLVSRGISGAKVSDVMHGAGLTVGGFYAHFDSKRALVDEAIRGCAEALRDKLFVGIEQKPAEARAEILLKRYLSAAHRDDRAGGCPLPAITAEIAMTSPEHRQVLVENIGALADRIAEYVPRGKSKRSTALAMVALMYGGLSLARAVKGTALSDEILQACRAFGRGGL